MQPAPRFRSKAKRKLIQPLRKQPILMQRGRLAVSERWVSFELRYCSEHPYICKKKHLHTLHVRQTYAVMLRSSPLQLCARSLVTLEPHWQTSAYGALVLPCSQMRETPATNISWEVAERDHTISPSIKPSFTNSRFGSGRASITARRQFSKIKK